MNGRIPLIAGNWKMHKSIEEALTFVRSIQEETGPMHDREVVVAPPFTALHAVRQALCETGYRLSAQNCHWQEKGAFTGEVSPVMLKSLGCDYVIIGHSERRQIFGETDEMIMKKTASVFAHDMTPIVCVGEVLEQREAGRTFDVVGSQLAQALDGLDSGRAVRIVIAYEPVWAIGTGRTATPQQAQEVSAFIRERLAGLYDKTIANSVRILYGGSVKPDNVDALIAQQDIDGMLVGGACLEVDSFARIVLYKS